MTKRQPVMDPYEAAQFSSLWKVVVHATEPDSDRMAAYKAAQKAMKAKGRWRGYEMVYSPNKRLHVGYRYMDPKDWFMWKEGDPSAEGPFPSKRVILRRLGAKASTTVGPGHYRVADWHLFTRDNAESVIGRRMEV